MLNIFQNIHVYICNSKSQIKQMHLILTLNPQNTLFVFDESSYCKASPVSALSFGPVAGQDRNGVHVRCTCSCTSAAPDVWRCGCAIPEEAGGCNGPLWVDAAGSARWTSGQSSRRTPVSACENHREDGKTHIFKFIYLDMQSSV